MSDKNKIIFHAESPYPPIKVEEPNLKYACLLQADEASDKSEFTSISQYVYQSWIFQACYKEIAHGIIKIAEVEMHHLDMLGKLIILLGGEPKLQSGYRIWNGNMVNYTVSPVNMLKSSIMLEVAAIETYEKQINYIKDKYIVDILKRIVEDEQIHLKIFNNYLSELC